MQKITREIALATAHFRVSFIAAARYRDELKRMACVGREDLDLMLDLGLISAEEKIDLECRLSQAVQKRLGDLMPDHLRVVGGVR